MRPSCICFKSIILFLKFYEFQKGRSISDTKSLVLLPANVVEALQTSPNPRVTLIWWDVQRIAQVQQGTPAAIRRPPVPSLTEMIESPDDSEVIDIKRIAVHKPTS